MFFLMFWLIEEIYRKKGCEFIYLDIYVVFIALNIILFSFFSYTLYVQSISRPKNMLNRYYDDINEISILHEKATGWDFLD